MVYLWWTLWILNSEMEPQTKMWYTLALTSPLGFHFFTHILLLFSLSHMFHDSCTPCSIVSHLFHFHMYLLCSFCLVSCSVLLETIRSQCHVTILQFVYWNCLALSLAWLRLVLTLTLVSCILYPYSLALQPNPELQPQTPTQNQSPKKLDFDRK